MSASPSPGFGLSWQTKVVMEICSELGYGVVDGVGGHMECLRDRICLELQDRDMLSELEKVVKKGVPLHSCCSASDLASFCSRVNKNNSFSIRLSPNNKDSLPLDAVTFHAFQQLGQNGIISVASGHSCSECTQPYKRSQYEALDQIEAGHPTVKMPVVDGIVMGPSVSIN